MGISHYFRSIKHYKKERIRFLEYDSDSILINGVTFKLEIFEGYGSSISAKIKNKSMVITIPRRLSKKKKIEAIERIKNRLVRRLEKLDKIELELMQAPNILFKEGPTLPLFNTSYIISVIYTNSKTSRGVLNNTKLELKLPASLTLEQKQKTITKLSKKLISNDLHGKVELLLNTLNEGFYNYKLNELRIREQQRLWGSYSRGTGNITLNLRLLFAPTKIIEYVIAHELSHIKISGHTKQFWNNVSIAIPDYKERRKWLRTNGNRLGFIEVSGYH